MEAIRKMTLRASPIERFWRHCSPEPNTGCWIWTSETVGNGYGRLRINGKNVFAHRFSYEQFKAPIPQGLIIDHLCRQPSCVNPDHLEPVTYQENTKRGLSPELFKKFNQENKEQVREAILRYHRANKDVVRLHMKTCARISADKKKAIPFCLRGHPLFGENLYEYKGFRHCRACKQIHKSTYRNKNRKG